MSKDKAIKFRVTEEEDLEIKRLAKELGLTVTDLIKMIVLSENVMPYVASIKDMRNRRQFKDHVSDPRRDVKKIEEAWGKVQAKRMHK